MRSVAAHRGPKARVMGGWQDMTDEALITYAEQHHSGDFAAAPGMQMERRLFVAIRDFTRSPAGQGRTMIRLTWAIVALAVCSVGLPRSSCGQC